MSKSIKSANVSQLSEFDEVLDVRSPAEYSEDHIPGAMNLPVLNDAERAHVGTIYKKFSSFEAKRIGSILVARNIAQHLEQVFYSKPKHWKPFVYCWRGGQRSEAMVHILRKVGWGAAQLEGGYKAFRRTVVQELGTLPPQFQFKVICGPTGSGKSRLLQLLADIGSQVIDLEKLAVHYGSVLGNVPNQKQPSQKSFESVLWAKLLSLDTRKPIYIEAESKKIGNIYVPDALLDVMWRSECIRLNTSMLARLELLKHDYQHFLSDTDLLFQQLDCLKKLHGGEIVSGWKNMVTHDDWNTLILELLNKHYDPAYQRSTLRHYMHFARAQVIDITDCNNQYLNQVAMELARPISAA